MWSPHTSRDILVLEAVQRHAAKWVCESRWDPSNRRWTKSSDDCLNALQWPTLTQRRNYLSVSMLNDIFHERTSLTFFQTITVKILAVPEHMNSLLCHCNLPFFVNVAFLWNSVPAHY